MKTAVLSSYSQLSSGQTYFAETDYLNTLTPVCIKGIYWVCRVTGDLDYIEKLTGYAALLQLGNNSVQLAQGTELYESAQGVLKGYPEIRPGFYVPLDLVMLPENGAIHLNLFASFTPALNADSIFHYTIIVNYENA